MNHKPAPPTAPGMTLGDIYYILFRHKWKILIISALGVAAALALPYIVPRPYQSDAKLFIRYVVENKSLAQVQGGDAQTKSPDQQGGGIIGTELEILTSLDLAQQVADTIGPEKILAKAGGGTNRYVAAGLIRGNLTVEVPNRSSVIHLSLKHPDSTMVQPILNELIESYFRRHAAIHRAVGVFDDFLTQETLQLRNRLIQTEQALLAAKTNAGIVSLEDSRKSYLDRLSNIYSDIYAAEAELAERRSVFEELQKVVGNTTNAATNEVEVEAPVVATDKVSEYRRLSSLLENLIKQEEELSLRYTTEHSQVKGTRERINATQLEKENLEKENPGLLALAATQPRAGQMMPVGPQPIDLKIEAVKINALVSKIKILTNQLAQVRKEAMSIDSVEGAITELQRKKELEEENYKYFSAKLEQSRIDEALGAGRISNISKIQEPTPPFRDDRKLAKMRIMALGGAIAGALALAFFIELVLDRSIRRPGEIQSQLRLPLFLSIPKLKFNGRSSLKNKRKVPLLAGGASANGDSTVANGSLAPLDIGQELRPFYETLRDRLIVFFEMNNLHHKPKLVAVTSCGEGAGVTTTAAGLAATLSETGEGNVLLVDMNLQQGEAHHYYKGRLDCGIDDVLEGGKRDSALVQENLYVVTEASKNDKLPQVLPKRFKHLIPRLRASDYDYIIFDMPPVSQISATPRLAQFMDMVFLVVESEKTDRELVKHASALLAESKANVGVVLNKSKAYVPKRLQHDL